MSRPSFGVLTAKAASRAVMLSMPSAATSRSTASVRLNVRTQAPRCREVATRATLAKVFLYHCTEKLLPGKLDVVTASMAKYWITEAQSRIIDECLQQFGGNGYMVEYP